MQRIWAWAFWVAVCMPVGVWAEELKGEYLEARNADIWTGPCFANGEVNIIGNRATLAWKVTEGAFDGVDLAGRSIVAVVFGNQTFGLGKPVQTKTLFIVDHQASNAQREALVAMAKSLTGDLIQEVVSTESAPIELVTGLCDGRGCARLSTEWVQIQTRCMHAKDSICGHEDLFYPVLSQVQQHYAAYTREHVFRGPQFGETYSHGNSRSAIIGEFGVSPEPTLADVR